MFKYKAEVLKVVDAATLTMRVELGLDVSVVLTARLDGIEVPKRVDLWSDARHFIANFCQERGNIVEIETIKVHDGFIRYNVIVKDGQTGDTLNDQLLTHKLAMRS